MRPFPENYELESFFECEPEVLDQNAPWAYNELTFNIEADNGKLQVKMVTGSEQMEVIWTQVESMVLYLNLKGVHTLKIRDEKRCDTLVAGFRSDNIDNLIIKVRPFISLTWGCDD